jgi:acyl-CoA thioesterase-1
VKLVIRTIGSIACAAIVLAACRERPGVDAGSGQPKDSAPPAVVTESRQTIVFVGTSLTAGYGLSPEQAFPARIQEKVDSAGLPFRVVNAGLSGETSAGAVRRIDWLFGQGPIAVLVIETGANDGLRGQSVDSLRANLREILERAAKLEPTPRIVVAGMEALPNLGPEYGRRFRAVYPELAAEYGATYLPFLLDGVAGSDVLNQADGIHPTAQGAQRVANNVWRVLEPVLRAVAN